MTAQQNMNVVKVTSCQNLQTVEIHLTKGKTTFMIQRHCVSNQLFSRQSLQFVILNVGHVSHKSDFFDISKVHRYKVLPV